MNHNPSAVVLGHLSVAKDWLSARLTPFYLSLLPLERGIFLLGMIPMPLYVFGGQFFLLLNAIGAMIGGSPINIPALIALLFETLLIIYAVFLLIRYVSNTITQGRKTVRTRVDKPHPCIVIRPVPLHLYHEERKSSPSDDAEFVKGFVDLEAKDASLLDHLPKALEILRDNAAMLEIYEQSHPKEEIILPVERKSKSLLEILYEKQRPAMNTAADMEKIIQSSNS